MPPVIPGRAGRQVQALAGPSNQARALALQQQGGVSGTIPGTTSDAQQVAVATGVIQPYPATGPSPYGDQVSGVGHAVLNSAGDPVVVLGNLNATQTSAQDLPSSFQDGGFAFVDADGNLVAGYSQETGLWGFSSGAALSTLAAWMDWITSPTMYVNIANNVTVPGYGITVPAMTPPLADGFVNNGLIFNAFVTQVGYYAGGSIGFWGNCSNSEWMRESPSAVVTAYTLDGANSIELCDDNFTGPDANGSYQAAGADSPWSVTAVTGSVFSAPAGELVVSGPCMMAVNYQLCGAQGD
jgi:hypothetical protein